MKRFYSSLTGPSNFNIIHPTRIVKEVSASDIKLKKILPSTVFNIPNLNYGLDRVLFNPGIHFLKDDRSNLYNFDPFLGRICEPEEFNFGLLPPFISASQDKNLMEMAHKNKAKFISSTSSISATMSMIYFIVNRMKPLEMPWLSSEFSSEPKSFTMTSRGPASVLLYPHNEGEVRSIIIEKNVNEPVNVLSFYGQIMERMLTENKEDFQKKLFGINHRMPPSPLNSSSHSPPSTFLSSIENYSYTMSGDLFLRSQLDCQNEHLPRRTFDIKTRATLPIRMDTSKYKTYRNYRLSNLYGLFGSFEREYYDMCRSAFLKYNFQVRIGNMDGIFVAYHNTFEMFGFQYIPREEIDRTLYGNSVTGDAMFGIVLQIYNEILREITPQFPRKAIIRITMAIDKSAEKLKIFADQIGGGGAIGDDRASPSLRYYQLKCYSTLDGIRTDHLLLQDPQDKWKVHFNLTQMKPDPLEYEIVRKQVIELRCKTSEDPDNQPSAFIKNAMKRSNLSDVNNGRIISAPWTFCK